MENEGQQPPLPQQGPAGQPDYYSSWQYDQEHPEVPQPPLAPQPPLHLPLPTRQSPPRPPAPRDERSAQRTARYKEPVPDMGTSLGYGQGMEYQFFDAPQPSQPLPQLRQERLQQLHEERMRRQQRRLGGDVTSMINWRGKGGQSRRSKQGSPGPQGMGSVPVAPMPPAHGVPGDASPQEQKPPAMQMSPVMSLPADELSPIRASTLPPPSMRMPAEHSPVVDKQLPKAAAPAQDTGMLQRVRIGRATMILTGAFVASRFLGLLRTSMFAFVFGTSKTSDAYLQAFLIPDLIFNIVAGGALSSAFIPVFTKYMVGDKDEKSAWRIASSALNLAIVVMVVLATIAILLAPVLVPIYNTAAIGDPTQMNLIINLTRIMLLQSIVLGAGVIVNAVLNARQNFLLPAIGTVVYNVGLIIGLAPGILLAVHGHRNDNLAVYAATWGVVLGALFQVGVQLPGLLKVGMRYAPAFDWRHPGVIQIGRQMVPRIINAAMLYLSIFVDRGLIQLLGNTVGADAVNGLITQYYQALQLVLLPLGIFGMAISTAAFPTLAENVAKDRFDRVRNTILETLRSILFMSVPSGVGLIVLGLPIIQVLLEHGAFSLSMAESTAVPLAFFAVGLVGLAAVEILTRSFYALRDSTTPVIISVGQFIFKIALSLILIDAAIWGAQWGMGALAFSTSVAGTLEAVVLFWLLHRRIGEMQIRTVGFFLGRVLLASLAMGAALLITRFVLDFILGVIANIPVLGALDTLRTQSLGLIGTFIALVKLLIELLVGAIVYIRVARLLGIEELGPVKRVLDRLKLSWI